MSSGSEDKEFALLSPRSILFGAAIVFTAALLSALIKTQLKNSDGLQYGLSYLDYCPRWISGWIYCTHALTLMDAAQKKHPDSPYKLVRLDTDIAVLPDSVVDELAGLPNEVASNILALQYDMVAHYTGLSMLQDVSLHLRVVQRRMMPNLAQLTVEIENEIADAINTMLPQTEGEWVNIDLYKVMLQVAARAFSRLVVGPQFCRDQRWLDFSMNFTENVLNSLVCIRYWPPIFHPLLKHIIPSVRASISNIRQVESLLVPVFTELLKRDDEVREKSQESRARHLEAQSPLSWFTDLASDSERDPVKLVHSQILLALGAIHTSLFAEMNMFHDLIANPEYITEIRHEIQLATAAGWSTASYGDLHKLDSILRESQRMSPPFLTGLRRVMKQDYIFANGTVVRKGQYVCVPTYSIQNNLTSNPSTFDGLRSYNLRAAAGSWKHSTHLFATTESSVLAFGHGRTACPGRYIASVALKILFTKVISEFDFERLDGSRDRAASKFAHEIVFPDATSRFKCRRRPSTAAPF